MFQLTAWDYAQDARKCKPYGSEFDALGPGVQQYKREHPGNRVFEPGTSGIPQMFVSTGVVKPNPRGKPDDKALPGLGEPGGAGESDPYMKPASCGAWL
eukprot:4181162-Amphidinium_carterae.2